MRGLPLASRLSFPMAALSPASIAGEPLVSQ
jgi:hypothetical protein